MGVTYIGQTMYFLASYPGLLAAFVACSTSDKHWGEKTWVRGYVLLLFGSETAAELTLHGIKQLFCFAVWVY